MLGDINPDGHSSPSWLTPFGDQLVFSATSRLGTELYKTDGDTIDYLANLNSEEDDGSSLPSSFAEFDGSLYFGARGPQGPEVYKYDGDRVTLLEDLNPNPGNGLDFPRELTQFGDDLVFAAFGPDGLDLFSTDGVDVTTLEDVNPGSDAVPYGFTEFADVLIFGARTEAAGFELYQLDGTDVSLVADIPNDPGNGSTPGNFVEFNGQLYFSAFGDRGSEIYALSVLANGEPFAASIPEPGAGLLIVMAATGLLSQRPRRRRSRQLPQPSLCHSESAMASLR